MSNCNLLNTSTKTERRRSSSSVSFLDRNLAEFKLSIKDRDAVMKDLEDIYKQLKDITAEIQTIYKRNNLVVEKLSVTK